MTTSLTTSPDLSVTTRGETTCILLPKMQLGPLRYGGYFLILFGLFFSGFALFWIAGAAGIFQGNPAQPGFFRWVQLGFAAFGLPFVVVGCVPLFLGFFTLACGPFELQLTPRHIRSVMHAGPLRWSRKRRIDGLSRLRVGKDTPDEGATMSGLKGSALFADCINAKPLLLAAGYPRTLLVNAANLLVDELHRRNYTQIMRPGSSASPVPAVTVDPGTPDAPSSEGDQTLGDALLDQTARNTAVSTAPVAPPPAQPANSKITFLPEPDSLTFILPRTGFRGTAGFFLFFSLFWNAISWAVFIAFLVNFLHERTFADFLPLLFILLFVAIGIATFLAAIQLAFRKAVILATRDALVVTQKGPILNREFEWTHDQLLAIRRDFSGTKINDRPLSELRIDFKDPAKDSAHKGFFDGRDESELDWLAWNLRDFYKLSHSHPA